MTSTFCTLACLMISSATTGASYTFSIYSSALKSKFSLSEPQLETISVACFCMGFFSFIPGLVGDKLGPRKAITLGGITQSSAFFLFWLLSTEKIPMPKDNDVRAVILSAVSIIQYLGSSLTTGQVYCTIVRNFSEQRGLVTGLIKGWVGLCGGMITQIFVGFSAPDLDNSESSSWLNFTLFASMSVVAATVIPSQFIEIRELDESKENIERRVYAGYVILLLMGSTVIASALVEKIVSRIVLLIFAITICCIWLSPVLLTSRMLDTEKLLDAGVGPNPSDHCFVEKEMAGTVDSAKPLPLPPTPSPPSASTAAKGDGDENVLPLLQSNNENDNLVEKVQREFTLAQMLQVRMHTAEKSQLNAVISSHHI